jgi:hypothetical protein
MRLSPRQPKESYDPVADNGRIEARRQEERLQVPHL